MTRTLAQWIAEATKTSKAWSSSWNAQKQLEAFLPSGSGIDAGSSIDWDRSTPQRLTCHCSFHHMNEHGYYDGWTEHPVVVKPAFEGLDITVKGRNRNGIKDYLWEVWDVNLNTQIELKYNPEKNEYYFEVVK